QSLTHTEFPLVHYRGGGPALADLLAGHVDLTTNQATVFLPHMRDGTLKIFAVLADHRLQQAPEIPTADEAGLPGFHTSVWQALWVPRGTPEPVIEALNKAVRAALADPKVRQRFADLGQEIPPAEQQTAQWLADFQKAEVDKWVPLVKAAKVKLD
ncbi:MAG TPA: tripartite tricarboxylate transporter substrate-binding protein, partial [Reyranella sp.]|nr:tripartite tricarboxylate transporter substrate-binding protein [Reyranella sp.]